MVLGLDDGLDVVGSGRETLNARSSIWSSSASRTGVKDLGRRRGVTQPTRKIAERQQHMLSLARLDLERFRRNSNLQYRGR